MPTPNDGPSIQDLVIQDMEARKQLGIARYRTPLQAFNGRNAAQDAYEEVLDLAPYFKQVLIEYDAMRDALEALSVENARLRSRLRDAQFLLWNDGVENRLAERGGA